MDAFFRWRDRHSCLKRRIAFARLCNLNQDGKDERMDQGHDMNQDNWDERMDQDNFLIEKFTNPQRGGNICNKSSIYLFIMKTNSSLIL